LRDIHDSGPEEILAINHQIQKVCLQEQDQHWQSLQTARAVSLTALARVLAVQSKEAEAERHLREALAAEPGLVAGYLHLAELYMRCRHKLSTSWASETEWLLQHTLELSPGCGQATFLLGSLYIHPLVGRSEEAEVLFRRLKANPEACLRMAKMTADRAETGEALVWLKRYIVLSRGLTDKGAEIMEQLLSLREMNEGERSNWRTLSEALEASSGDLTGQEAQRISTFLVKIKLRQLPAAAAGAGS
jgi:hypothetical protein